MCYISLRCVVFVVFSMCIAVPCYSPLGFLLSLALHLSVVTCFICSALLYFIVLCFFSRILRYVLPCCFCAAVLSFRSPKLL
jgi:hypothetical protein